MRVGKIRRGAATVAALASAALVVAGCGSSDDENGTAGGTSPGEGKAECAQLTSYGDLTGREVHVYTGIVEPEDKAQKDSYKLFTECTGATVNYEGSKDFEAQVVVRARGGNAPDIAYVPQPGLLKTLVQTKAVKPAPQAVADNVDKWFGEDWKSYGTVDGTFYAAPLGANVKSFVWYSPKMFKANGWTVPTTWADLIKLSDEAAAKGIKPWCAGFESGEATGWPGTDWLEDMVLRTAGPDVYTKWLNHEIPFNDPQIATALDRAGSILKNPKYVNGGIGDVKSIATTAFQEGGLPILDGKCAFHRQASFYAANWPEGTKVTADGDVFAFYLPGDDASSKPVLGGGEFVAAFNDKPETQAFQTFLSSDTWANEKAKATPDGGWVSANKGLDVNNLTSPIDKLSASILQDPNAVFRFDASDLMPAEVGSGSFWKQMVNWITGQDTKTTLDEIEKSWPTS
ncbi:ABC transporter substrate-binding protein [Nocardioides nematodiphilus]|uniref:ABC transporter substrate-binding protein n=1 Tax=Nocardioides nematodiphilus TaxID=2849669 RepID=UPI001CD9C0FD|nr:ABC transporter substrate-binding protein [Nocardioides nematodiphilus]MCA1981359.1 ABC transporter substrate-binding protein [Nocardioides nematodiphilus]